jgi:redox-sensing transcriptional repressor
MPREHDRRSVPAVTVPRLALYLRKLRELQTRGVERVSSKDLAGMIDLNAAQIRKDFSYFGEFGTRGVGYEVDVLVDEIRKCLGLTRNWNVIIIGAGSLGSALARYRGFASQGFRLVAMFDASPKKVGVGFGEGRAVRDIAELEDFLQREHVDIAIVTVPATAAQSIIDRLVAGDPERRVRAVLNFAPVKVFAPRDVVVRQVDFSSELMFLSFHLDREND